MMYIKVRTQDLYRNVLISRAVTTLNKEELELDIIDI